MYESGEKQIPEDAHLHLEELIPPRARLEKSTRAPVESACRGVSKMDAAIKDKKPSMWMATGRGKLGTHQWPQRGGHREVPVDGKQRGEGPADSASSWKSRWREW